MTLTARHTRIALTQDSKPRWLATSGGDRPATAHAFGVRGASSSRLALSVCGRIVIDWAMLFNEGPGQARCQKCTKMLFRSQIDAPVGSSSAEGTSTSTPANTEKLSSNSIRALKFLSAQETSATTREVGLKCREPGVTTPPHIWAGNILKGLRNRGLVTHGANGAWVLTSAGKSYVESLATTVLT